MFDRKKFAAFVAGLMICAASAVSPIASFADNEEAAWGAAPEISAPDPTELYTVSGDFMYSLTHDGNICIENCTGTGESLVIPDTIDGIRVTELGKTALGSDPESNTFVSVTIPASIEYISADNPFMYCTRLREITVAEGNTAYTAEDGILYDHDKTKLICYPYSREGSSFTIPEGVVSVGTAAFYDSGITSVKFPASLEEIGVFAFGDLTKMKSADLSNTKLDTIQPYAFSNCSELSEILLPDTLTVISGGAFAGCKALKEMTLPDSLLSIEQYAFFDTGLSFVMIPDSVENIGYSAFGYYTDENGRMTSNDNFTIIGSGGSAAHIYATDSDTDYDYKNNFRFMTPAQYEEQQDLLALDRISSGDYEYAVTSKGAVLTTCKSSDKTITVPAELDGNKIIAIYPVCFSSCSAEEIILPDTIEELREMSFYNCTELKSITIPASVKSIGNNAFDNCQKLETIEILGAETIGSYVFYNCTGLKSITAAGCLREWKDEEPFIYCSALEEINITEGEGEFSSENGILYSKDKSKLICFPMNKADKSFKASAQVKEIAQSAFMNNQHITSVEFPSIEIINAYAFEGCENLSSVTLAKTLISIGTDAFYDCCALKSLRLYENLTDIGVCAFGYCANENATAENGEPDSVIVEGFKLYAPKDSTAYNFGKSAGMEVISGTTRIFGKNMDKSFLGVICGIIAAAVLALVGILTGRSMKKKKAAKELAERKAKSAERRKKQSEADNDEDNEEEETNEDQD